MGSVTAQLLYNWEYILCNAIGILLLTGSCVYTARQNSLGWRLVVLLISGQVLMLLLGGRILYFLLYTGSNWPIAHLWDLKLYGFSLFGGLLFTTFYLFVVAKILDIPLWKWLDRQLPGILMVIVWGKIGCFLNGCCFGSPTIMPWGISYASNSQAYNYYIVQAFNNTASHSWTVYSDRIHPVQLYEVAIAIALLITTFILLRRRVLPGTVFLFCAAIYSLARLGLLHLRANPEIGTYFYLLPWLYVAVAGLSLVILLFRLYFENKSETRGSVFK